MAPPSPEVAKLEFAKRIRDRRRELELSALDVSKALGFSRVYLSAIENGRENLSAAKMPALAKVLKLTKADRKELEGLLATARQPGWWDEYSKVIPEHFAPYIGLEHGAARASTFDSSVVPGLLQTRAYAEAIVAASTVVAIEDRARTVDVRMRRQGRLSGSEPLRLSAIVSEAVLMQQFGGPAVLADQLKSIVDRIESGWSVEFRVQPFDRTPMGLFTASTVVLLDFDSPHLSTVTWREAGEGLGVSDDPELVARLGVQLEQLRQSSLSPNDSLALLRSRVAVLSTGGS